MKRIKLVLLPILVCILLSGCGGRSLSDYTIVEGVGIDKKGDNTVVSLQYLNLAKSSGATDSLTENITTVEKGESVNISDALFSASKALSNEIFFGQNKLVVFGSDYVRDDISIGLDYLLRSVDSRPDVLVAVSSSTAEKVIKSTQRDARIPMESIYDLIETGEKNGLGVVVTVNDLLRLYSTKTSDIYMPILKVEDDLVACSGVAVFSNERFALSLDSDRTLAFLTILDRVEDASMVVHDNELGNVGIELVDEHSKRYVTLDNGRIIFHCDIKVEIVLDDIENGVTAAVSEDRITKIEHLAEKKLHRDIVFVFQKCAVSKSDPIEIGKYLAKASPSVYDELKDDWRDYLGDIDYDVSVDVKLSKINDSSTK